MYLLPRYLIMGSAEYLSRYRLHHLYVSLRRSPLPLSLSLSTTSLMAGASAIFSDGDIMAFMPADDGVYFRISAAHHLHFSGASGALPAGGNLTDDGAERH